MNTYSGKDDVDEQTKRSDEAIQKNLKRVANQIDEVKEKKVDKEITGGQMTNMGQDANAGQTRDDSSTSTRLLDKNWSPLVVRKYQMEGWPMFIGIICDANLNDLDEVVYNIWDEAKELGFVNGTIQGHRNCCGLLSDRLVAHYNKTKRGVMEGNCVYWYTDKLAISSAYGDLMTHNKCAMEFYSILQMMPHI
jgi:hypothetical protein